MSITDPTKSVAHRTHTPAVGPHALFAVTILATFALLAGATSLAGNLLWPIASTLLLGMAGAAALIGWLRDRRSDHRQVTYWDVAGALTLVGIGASALVDPDQLVRIFEAPQTEK